MKKGVIILGSTGSIGRSTLEVIESRRDEFEVVGLACRENVPIFNEQIQRFRPRFACLFQEGLAHRVDFGASRKLTGPEGIKELVGTDGEIVVNAMPGSAGLEPTIEALKCRKVLGLANKESLVMAGRLISSLARRKASALFPIDSEHSALYQLMQGLEKNEIESIVITASGGPFRDFSAEALRARDGRAGASSPHMADGQKGHDRFRDPHEQGPRGHRGALAFRHGAGEDQGARSIRRALFTAWCSSSTAPCWPTWPARTCGSPLPSP